MSKNQERFTGKADIYKKFRSSYPYELIEYLYSQIGFGKSSIIADIGSGTGIFSRLLLERGSFVYGVEPNDDMRKTAERDLIDVSGFKNFTSINSPAENTGLKEKSFDFVTAAQAFHWFDRSSFKAECKRILKNEGQAVLVWNKRDVASDFNKRDYIIREKYCIDTKGFGDNGGPPKDLHDFFIGKSYEKRFFRNDLAIDRETYIGMNLSRSYSPRENKNPDKYCGFVKEMNRLFDEYSSSEVVRFAQITESYIGKV